MVDSDDANSGDEKNEKRIMNHPVTNQEVPLSIQTKDTSCQVKVVASHELIENVDIPSHDETCILNF